mmetsp:Transcript_14108/g.41377  ORF Transcript_14108/g.41377 Transcript_14108/m.41377 type:complete len:245 (+) Transcript_14108:862-1596(+)
MRPSRLIATRHLFNAPIYSRSKPIPISARSSTAASGRPTRAKWHPRPQWHTSRQVIVTIPVVRVPLDVLPLNQALDPLLDVPRRCGELELIHRLGHESTVIQRLAGFHDPHDRRVNQIQPVARNRCVRLGVVGRRGAEGDVRDSYPSVGRGEGGVVVEGVVVRDGAADLAGLLGFGGNGGGRRGGGGVVGSVPVHLGEDAGTIPPQAEALEDALGFASVLQSRLSHDIQDGVTLTVVAIVVEAQ